MCSFYCDSSIWGLRSLVFRLTFLLFILGCALLHFSADLPLELKDFLGASERVEEVTDV